MLSIYKLEWPNVGNYDCLIGHFKSDGTVHAPNYAGSILQKPRSQAPPSFSSPAHSTQFLFARARGRAWAWGVRVAGVCCSGAWSR